MSVYNYQSEVDNLRAKLMELAQRLASPYLSPPERESLQFQVEMLREQLRLAMDSLERARMEERDRARQMEDEGRAESRMMRSRRDQQDLESRRARELGAARDRLPYGYLASILSSMFSRMGVRGV